MANRTDTDAAWIHGFNPQFLISKIVRYKIYEEPYWKEHCFALTAESLIDKAANLDYIGGTYGGRRKPTKFLCLFNKMLQIQPDEDVVLEYIKQPDLKYLRVLGAAYLRMTAKAMLVYRTLEPLFADYRKIRWRDMDGKFRIIHVDEFIEKLLHDDDVFDCSLPAIPKREQLEELQDLEAYVSPLVDELEDFEAELEEATAPAKEGGEDDEDASGAVTGEENDAEDKQRSRSPSKKSESAKRSRSPRQRRSRSASRRRRSPEKRRRSRSRSEKRRRKSRSARRSRSAKRSRSRRRDKRSTSNKRRDRSRSRRNRRDEEEEEPEDDYKTKEVKQVKRHRFAPGGLMRVEKEKRERSLKRDEFGERIAKDDEVEKSKTTQKGLFKATEDAPKKEKKSKKEGKEKDPQKKGKKDEGPSVDEWNEIRKNLGIKPLKK